jgi:hypothetical protein
VLVCSILSRVLIWQPESEEEESEEETKVAGDGEEEVRVLSFFIHSFSNAFTSLVANMSPTPKRRNRSCSSDPCSYPSAYSLVILCDARLYLASRRSRRARVTVAERETEAQDTEEALERQKQKEEERKKQSHDMVADSIRRELAESAFTTSSQISHMNLISSEEKEEEVIDVDDTDGLDPEAEFDAWRLRELARIKRDKEAEIAREQEREEIERRRALPEEQRLKEDMEHANKLRADKPKGQQKFLQKYWHKGAFHQVYLLSFFARSFMLTWSNRTKKSSGNTTLPSQPSRLSTYLRCRQ